MYTQFLLWIGFLSLGLCVSVGNLSGNDDFLNNPGRILSSTDDIRSGISGTLSEADMDSMISFAKFEPGVDVLQLQKKAFAGNERAKAELAVRAFYGEGLPIDYEIAVSYCRETEHPIAQYILSRALLYGDGILQNKSEAERLLNGVLGDIEQLAADGDGVADYCLGRVALSQNPPDPLTAKMYFQKAIREGCYLGLEGLGGVLLQSKRIAEIERGIAILKTALDYQSANAARQLAMYFSRKGDVLKETDYLRFAVRMQEPSSMIDLGLILMENSESRKGAALIERALQKCPNSPEALTMLGFSYYRGAGVGKDCARALQYAKRAVAHGSADACILLAYLYESGLSVPKNAVMAFAWTLVGVAKGSNCRANLKQRDKLEGILSAAQIMEGQAYAKRLYEQLTQKEIESGGVLWAP